MHTLTNLRNVGVESTATIVDDFQIVCAELKITVAAISQPDKPQAGVVVVTVATPTVTSTFTYRVERVEVKVVGSMIYRERA